MARKISMLAPQWWDYTTLDDAILDEAARLTPEDMLGLSHEGFKVFFMTPWKIFTWPKHWNTSPPGNSHRR